MMIQKHRTTLLAIIATAAMVVLLGCSFANIGVQRVALGPLQTESVTIEPQGATAARINLRMGGGELNVSGGANALMDADFTYNVQAWKPEVSYNVTSGDGNLTVRQPNTDEVSIREGTRYTWDLRFGDQIPLDMRVDAGAGKHDIDLTGLQVTQLDVQVGAGQVVVDASDNPQLSQVDLDLGAGEAEIDLSGAADQNVGVDVQGGVGSTTLHLPKGIGVRVTVNRGIGDLTTSGLTSQGGNVWVNEAYGNTDVTMNVNISTGIGRVALDVR